MNFTAWFLVLVTAEVMGRASHLEPPLLSTIRMTLRSLWNTHRRVWKEEVIGRLFSMDKHSKVMK